MTLREKFQTDTAKTANGVWFDYNDAPNADGSVPGFRLARLSVSNPRYAKLLQDIALKNEARTPSQIEDEREGLELFVDSVLLEWRNFEPTDGGIEPLTYTRENALEIFGNPEWRDLYIDLRVKAMKQANYAKARLDATVKN